MGFVEAARNPRQGFGTVKSRVRQNVSGTVRNGRNIADAEYPVRVTKTAPTLYGWVLFFVYKKGRDENPWGSSKQPQTRVRVLGL